MGGLSKEAHRLAAVLGFVLVSWITEALPIPLTALLGATLCVLFQVAPAADALAPFADPIVFLFIGSFILAEAMTQHQLDRRFALAIFSIKGVGDNPYGLLCACGLISVLISMWISNTAATAMMLPIGVGLLRAMDDLSLRERVPDAAPENPFGKTKGYHTGVMLIIAYGASVGGIGTPVGSPPNLIGIGLIEKLAGVKIQFFQWMALCVPMMLVMFVVLFALLAKLHPSKQRHLAGVAAYVQAQRAALSKWTPGQRNTLIAFGTAVFLWVLPGFLAVLLGTESPVLKGYNARFHEGVVAILAAGVLFFLPTNWKRREFTLTWESAVRIDWGTILLFGGGLSLGKLMFQTRLAEAIGNGLIGWVGASSLWGITFFAIALGILISETTSNTASANMVIPVMIAIAQAAKVPSIPPALGACLGASFGFMLPVSTPPNAIVYGSGLVPILAMIKAGILFDLCGLLLIWLGLRILCPLLGLS
jgi:sodium-dependent dicarboxylate transporter 2/3/5